MVKTFSLFEMDDLIRHAGAERVDENASKKLSELLEEEGEKILEKALILAKHAGRTQVNSQDVLLAVQV